ncbi:MAG: decarboxylating 6-phosphogluconate dehydrogenase [Actinomycetota bacterium]|nr:decarboxylating 6-phosphogluconate dehydrogenase [Actinomycetota bacterium]
MQIAFLGLGRMGGSMVQRILRDSDHEVVAWSRSREPVERAAGHGATGAESVEDVVARLEPPRHLWLMVPAGGPTQSLLERLLDLLTEGDLIVDGGNSRWTDTQARAELAASRGIEYVDVGTSGGVWGLEVGYCMMVGGSEDAVGRLAPVLDVLAPPDGWGHLGPSGAGHYVKMVHNGVEYGLMQAYAEGFELMHRSDFDLDLAGIAHLWNQGSVVRSWLCELAERAFSAEGKDLERLEGYVEDSGEGRWTLFDAIDRDLPTPVLALSLMMRFSSRDRELYSAKVLAALRNQFGGHAVRSAEPR